MAYHQKDKSGYISPRKLVQAQQTIASSKHGCRFINGQAESIERDEHSKEKFNITIRKYSSRREKRSVEDTSLVTIEAKRIIIANGAYCNVKPSIQVNK